MACSRYLREGVRDLTSAGTEGEGVGLIIQNSRFSIYDGDARCGMCKPAAEMKTSLHNALGVHASICSSAWLVWKMTRSRTTRCDCTALDTPTMPTVCQKHSPDGISQLEQWLAGHRQWDRVRERSAFPREGGLSKKVA